MNAGEGVEKEDPTAPFGNVNWGRQYGEQHEVSLKN